jgi:DNA repair exonuclease SbcCD ATPase subunit
VDPTEPRERSYEAVQSAEFESEREAFIADRRQQISEVSEQMADLRAKLAEPSDSADVHQRAEWSKALFELEQERDRLDAELDRAQRANDEDWQALQGDVPVALDLLQADVTKLGDAVTNFVAKVPKFRADTGLCPVYVSDVRAGVATKGTSVLVEITTDDDEDVAPLRERALDLSQLKNYRPGAVDPRSASEPGASGQGAMRSDATGELDPIPLQRASVENIDDGVRLTLVAAVARHRERFLEAVSEDAKRLGAGDCEPAVSRQEISN